MWGKLKTQHEEGVQPTAWTAGGSVCSTHKSASTTFIVAEIHDERGCGLFSETLKDALCVLVAASPWNGFGRAEVMASPLQVCLEGAGQFSGMQFFKLKKFTSFHTHTFLSDGRVWQVCVHRDITEAVMLWFNTPLENKTTVLFYLTWLPINSFDFRKLLRLMKKMRQIAPNTVVPRYIRVFCILIGRWLCQSISQMCSTLRSQADIFHSKAWT